jgi:hypothetical protein
MAFDLQPILRGELVELLPLQADDFTELFAVAADPRDERTVAGRP